MDSGAQSLMHFAQRLKLHSTRIEAFGRADSLRLINSFQNLKVDLKSGRAFRNIKTKGRDWAKVHTDKNLKAVQYRPKVSKGERLECRWRSACWQSKRDIEKKEMKGP